MRLLRCCLGALLLGLSLAQAQVMPPKEASDLPSRTEKLHRTHQLSADGTEVLTDSIVVRVLRADALEQIKTYTIGHSASVQTLEVLEAYTLKAGGRRIPVPKGNTQVNADSGQGGGGPLFSDWRRVSITFPDLAVGDAVAIRYRRTTREPLFPGQFSSFDTFARNLAFDDVRVTVDMPAAMTLRHAAKGMQERVQQRGQRRLIEWTLQNPRPQASERKAWSVWDLDAEPHYALSTFATHREIAERYVQRAAPRAAVTPRLKELAERIAGAAAERREQARLLFEWVSRTLTYGGNCVGIGAVVPRDLNLVLDNRMGDCKDHATLLQALLAARGIESHQVLVNSGNLYRLYELPVASQVNHVINYVPELKLFMDATAKGRPFDSLHFSVQQKPVLAAVAGLPERTPSDTGPNEQRMSTALVIRDDGGADGTVRVELQGDFAIELRSAFRRLSREQVQGMVKEVFAGSNLQAMGTVTHDDPEPLLDRFSYEARFDVKRLLPATGSGAMPIAPMFVNPGAVFRYVQGASADVSGDHDSACRAGRSVETYDIQLPPRLEVLAVPQGTAFNTRLVGYESSYQRRGSHGIEARRALDDRSPANVCSAEVRREFRDALAPVWDDIRQQLLYR
jgi:transglutaminase-like putative cysteine protease